MRKMPNFLSVIRSKIPRHFTQVLATLAVSLGPFAAGLGKGYSSPALASLQESKTSSFYVTPQEGSWVASLSLLGALFGCLFGGLMLQLGRKRSLLIVAIPFSGSWLLTVFAQRVEMMYSTSFIGGFFSAVILLATQVYVSEIAHPEIRGCLSAVLKMAGHLGTLSSSTLGAFLDWRQLATVAAGAPILFFLAILLIPETPSFLLYHGRDEEASKSMAWLRSSDEDVASEMETLRSNIMTKHKSFLPKCSSQFPFRQLFITCGLMFFQKFSGVTVFHHYAVPIFKQVFGRSLNPHMAAIVVVLLQLLGSMTSGLLIDTAGRLPLLILSNLFISGSFFGFGLYNWMEESLPPSYPGFGPSLDWIPLTCVLFFTLFFSIGIGPISWLMVGELFPLEYRGFGGAVSTSFSYACAFAAVKTYVDIRAHLGLYGAFWIYSGISIAGLFFVCCFVPETKGVELEEMEHHSNLQNTVPAAELNPNASVPFSQESTNRARSEPRQTRSANLSTSCFLTQQTSKASTTGPSTNVYSKIENQYPPPLRTPPGTTFLEQVSSSKNRKQVGSLASKLQFQGGVAATEKVSNDLLPLPLSSSTNEPRLSPGVFFPSASSSSSQQRSYDPIIRETFPINSFSQRNSFHFSPDFEDEEPIMYHNDPHYHHQHHQLKYHQQQQPHQQYYHQYQHHIPQHIHHQPPEYSSLRFPGRSFLQQTQYHPLAQPYVSEEFDSDREMEVQYRGSYSNYVTQRGVELVADGRLFRPRQGTIV